MSAVRSPLQADPSGTDAAEVARALGADLERGLTAAEAARRLAEQGRNELRGASPLPTWARVLAHFQDPLIYLLLAAIVIALAAWSLEGRAGWPVDAIGIAAVVLLNGALGFMQEAKVRDAVAALARMTEATSAVLRDGQPLRVPSAELVRGDLLLLSEGDAVGADARLLEATTLRVQEASLTGESEAVLKDAATLPAAVPLGDRLNMVFKGTAVAQGGARAIVTATAMDTEMGAIAKLLEAIVDEPTPLAREVARIGGMLGIAVVIIAVVVMGTLFALSDIGSASDVTRVLLLGVSLAVAAVMALATLLTIDFYLPAGLIDGNQTLDNARTAGFTALVLVLAQLFNCFDARSDRTSSFVNPFVNRWLWGSIALAVLLQVAVVHLAWLNVAFGTVPLTLEQWALCTAMTSAVLWASELRKLALRAWAAR